MSDPITRSKHKIYLGDGAYVDFDLGLRAAKLTAENGLEATNTIYLGPDEMAALIRWWRERLDV